MSQSQISPQKMVSMRVVQEQVLLHIITKKIEQDSWIM